VRRTTWAAVAKRTRRFANLLRALEVQPGESIATLAWNHEQHLELYFAVPGVGASLHPLHPRHAISRLAEESHRARDALIFHDPTFSLLVDAVADSGLASLRRSIALTDEVLEPLLANQRDDFDWPAVTDQQESVDRALTLAAAADERLRAGEVVLVAEPMSLPTTADLIYAAALRGAKLVLPGFALDVQSLLALAEQERVTCLVGPVALWANLLTHLKAIAAKPTRVRTVWIGDQTVQPGFVEAWSAHGARVVR
jgi:3-(methylthio)propionyl---CoA ligase